MKWKPFPILLAFSLIVLIGIYIILDPETNELSEAERARLGGTYVNLSEGITHYKLEGRDGGKLVVLVHGGTVPMWTWDNQVQSLKDAGFKVLRYDTYGRGYSDRPKVTYDQKLYQRQLLELVDKLDLTEKFDLIGYSLGGGTVINFTAQNPQRVRKLVLISPLINNFKIPSIFRIPIFGEFMARLIGIKVITKRFVSLVENNPESEKYTKLFKEQTTYKGFQQSILSMLRKDALGDYSDSYKIVGNQERNILLIWGTEDAEVSKQMISEIQSLISHLKFKPVEGVGHGIVFQKPDTVNDFILSFLK
jgi:pimeloyl-ACP methyl ester carboxylesterase